jgi:hypothetical protein
MGGSDNLNADVRLNAHGRVLKIFIHRETAMRFRMIYTVTLLVTMGFSRSALSETNEECIQRLQRSLSTCYNACATADDAIECRKVCRERYVKHLAECVSE